MNQRVNTAQAAPADLFGHPRGLAILFGTEMWERFSYYGMRALLVLYLVKYLLLPGNSEQVIGLATLKSALERVFGHLDAQPFASQIYGLYGGLVYLTPVLGGLLADRVLGQRRTVIIGALLMSAGHFMMAFEPLLLFALTLLIIGNGAFKPNITSQVGRLYAAGDDRRDRAYSIFYVGINIGAFFSPLVCGTLAETRGWHYGFAAAGVGMLIGLAVYVFGMKYAPPDALQERTARREKNQPLTREEWRAIYAILLIFLPTTLFWASYEQQGNTIALWADGFTDRSIDLGLWQTEIPVTWFQAFNPFMIFAFTPLVIGLWERQSARGTEPGTVSKMALGCLGVAVANLIMVFAAWSVGDGGKASWLWLAAYFVVLTLGELYISPIGLSFVSKTAPPRILSMMMGLWLGTSFVGIFLSGWLGAYWSTMSKPDFFLMIAAVAAFASLAIFAIGRPMRAMTAL